MARPRQQEEIRDERVSVVLTKTLKEDLQLLANLKNISMNELIFRNCETIAEENRTAIQKFRELKEL